MIKAMKSAMKIVCAHTRVPSDESAGPLAAPRPCRSRCRDSVAFVMLAPAPLAHHAAVQRLELLPLFRCQHLPDRLHRCDMRHLEVHLFGGHGEELLLTLARSTGSASSMGGTSSRSVASSAWSRIRSLA